MLPDLDFLVLLDLGVGMSDWILDLALYLGSLGVRDLWRFVLSSLLPFLLQIT